MKPTISDKDATDEELQEIEAELEEEEDEDDASDYYDDMEDDIYGPDGDVVYSRYYESLKVDRTCTYCKRSFRGMPDHGVCDRCADRIERGDDIYCD